MGLNRLGSYLSQQLWNENVDRLERLAGTTQGRGVLQGLELAAGTGLEVTVSAGTLVDGAAAQDVVACTVSLPASTSRYVWMNASGVPVLSSSSADPGAGTVCLGRVYTDADSVTAVTTEGRTEGARWTDLRRFEIGNSNLVLDSETGRVAVGGEPVSGFDVYLPSTFSEVAKLTAAEWVPRTTLPSAPSSGFQMFAYTISGSTEFRLQDATGSMAWTRQGCPVSFGESSATLVMVGDVTLSARSSPVQALDPGTADRSVKLPASPDWGSHFRILNIGSSHTISVFLSDGVTSVTTLDPGEWVDLRPEPASGSAAWPTGIPSSGGS